MKIVTREEFLQLPVGTVYRNEGFEAEPMCLKTGDLRPWAHSVDERPSMVFDAILFEAPGEPYEQWESGLLRDIAVYELDDLLKLRDLIDRAIVVAGP